MFGSRESTTSSDSDITSGSDNDSFLHYVFSWTKKLLMVSSSSKKSKVEDYDTM